MKYIGWEFPLNNFGRIDGLNDSGIHHFMSDPIISMTREVLQDSLDAVFDKTKPVIVIFEKFDLLVSDLPEFDQLENIFIQCLATWKENQEAANFFDNALKLIRESKKIPILAIRDFNTTGLENIGDQIRGGFNSLVKSVGVTHKPSTANGSFGIGKHAPFATSSLRTMIYGTYNHQEEKAIQGVAKLASYDTGTGIFTQGTGYYGIKKDLSPLRKISKIHSKFQRQDYGTDKFVIGFNGKAQWYVEVVEAIVSSYLVAVMEEMLEVRIAGLIINKVNMKAIIKFVMDKKPKSLVGQFYEAYISEHSKVIEKIFLTPKGEEELIKLFLLTNEGFKKKIAMYRGSGMKIFEKDRFRTPIEFSGVIVVQGKRLNEIFRKMEPPTHDKWEANLYLPGLGEPQDYAKNLMKDLNEWLRDETKKLILEKEEDVIELKGLENILPNVTEQEAPFKKINEQSAINEKVIKINYKKVAVIRNSYSKQEKGKIKRGRKEKEVEKTPLKENSINKRSTTTQRRPRAEVERIRLFRKNDEENRYRLIVVPSEIGDLTLTVKIAVEVGKANDVQIKNVFHEGKAVTFEGNKIGPIEVVEKNKLIIDVEFETMSRYSLEVTV